MTSQRACGAGMQVRNSLSNGPRRALSKVWFCAVLSIQRRSDTRQLSGVCWYPEKCAGLLRIKVAPRITVFVIRP